jgi:hypothetical protein
MKKLAIGTLLAGALSAGAYAAPPAQLDNGAMPAGQVVEIGNGVVPGTTTCTLPGAITETGAGVAYCEAKTRTWQLASVSQPGAADPGNSDYQVILSPPPTFVPTKVWDDGKFTYIQLRAPYNGDLPVVLAENEPGNFELLNAKWDQKSARFVIPGLITRAVMKLGDKYVEIDRTKTAQAPTLVREVWPQDRPVILGSDCEDVYNGAFGNTTAGQTLVCAGKHWRDGKSLPQAQLQINYVDRNSKGVDASSSFLNFVGVTNLQQRGSVITAAAVDALSSDGTAHVTADIMSPGATTLHVDRTVLIGQATTVGQIREQDVQMLVNPVQ